MKVSEAEKLVCPFMSNQSTIGISDVIVCNCITVQCMAWKVTKTYSGAENGAVYPVGEIPIGNKLSSQDCEGYCIKLKI